jgi:chromosome segregation ATPase
MDPMASSREYRQKLEDQLKDWDAKIGVLEGKTKQVLAEARTGLSTQVQSLRAQEKVLEEKFAELKDRGEEGWENLKGGVDKAASSLKSALDKALSQFR